MDARRRKGEQKKEFNWGKGNEKEEFNWCKHNVIHPTILDQGKCDACWAICLVASIEACYKIKDLDPKAKLLKLSVQELVNCVEPDQRDCYTYRMENAFRWVKKNGVCLEEDYDDVFVAKKLKCKKKKNSSRARAIFIRGFEHVVVDDEEALVNAVKQHPVVFELTICDDFENYKGGIYRGPKQNSEKKSHGILIVGYGTDDKGVRYWLGKNSWGETWGEKGYVRVVRKSSNRGQPSFIETATYPII